MANLKASQKDILRIQKRTDRNRQVKSALKTLRSKLNKSVQEGDKGQAREYTALYFSALDKAAKRRIIHRNKANRPKSPPIGKND